jgi:phage-related protein
VGHGLKNRTLRAACLLCRPLEREGALLAEPYTRQLSGKLREPRFHLDVSEWRITYFIGSGRRIVLLTFFRKTQRRETREIARALKTMERCMTERHLEEEAH